ncbi:glycosyltransferase [Pseudomonas sp. NA-150]|uniref:glycosyltransferase n=1 Tax=Pseudomonas sp. NA-150 TaxID=3367525 RepID=UPI0037C811F8
MNSTRLVSIVIPAYKPDHFEATLVSALRQNHDQIEIVICDDSPSDAIAAIVDRVRVTSPWPIRYVRNEARLGKTQTLARGIAEASGNYIKFLYDDDILFPDCVGLLFEALEQHPEISLASSHRQFIDEHNNFLPDTLSTRFPFAQSTILDGKELLFFLGQQPINFIGEPSSVMCRRTDVLALGAELMSLKGQLLSDLADLSLYVKLLRLGHLAMIDRTLSCVRISQQNYARRAQDTISTKRPSHELFQRQIGELGWFRNLKSQGVSVASMAQPHSFASFDLLAYFQGTSPGHGSVGNVEAWLAKRVPSAAQQSLIEQRLTTHPTVPNFLIVVSDLRNHPEKLATSLRSLTANATILPQVSVVVLSDYNDLPYSLLGTRLQWQQATLDSRPSVLNRLVEQLAAETWVMLVDAGSEFTASGLLSIALELTVNADHRAFYADELHRQPSGELGVVLRPDFNLDYLLSFPMAMSRHWLFRAAELQNIGGFATAYPEALELDLILRLVENHGLKRLGHISEPLLIGSPLELEHNPDELAVLQRHLDVRGYPNSEILQTLPRRYHIQYGHTEQPLVSIIVPTKDHLNLIRRCVESLLEKTAYQHYEILIVDNNSEDRETLEWMAGIDAMGIDKIRVLRYPHPFNYSAINNMAAQQARGDYLVLLNDDTAILNGEWLDELLNHAMRPEVGIVGARLLYPNGTLQHAGVVLGMDGPAKHLFGGQPLSTPSYMQRLDVDQNYSVVTAACLMIRTSLFHGVGGLDEEKFKVSYNDVDLCLKVGATGHLIVWTPHATLLHVQNVSQVDLGLATGRANVKRFLGEQEALNAKWQSIIGNDPAYNKNFALKGPDFALEQNIDLTWRPLSWRPLPVVLGHPARPWGSATYRLIKPFQSLRDRAQLEGALSPQLLSFAEFARFDPDAVILQRRLTEAEIDDIRIMKAYTRAFKVYELDELPMPGNNPSDAQISEALVALHSGLKQVDRLVVSSSILADALSEMHSNIRVIEDRLPQDWWQARRSLRRQSKKPRVGWAGGANQQDNLQLLIEVVKTLAHEVEWVFMGTCPPEIIPYIHDFRPEPAIEFYPAALASLNLDLALAPVKDSLFHELRSNLMLLKYGACGIPVVCSDVRCFQGELSVTRVKNQTADWVNAIRAHLNDRDASEHMGDELRGQVMDRWMLDDAHQDRWLAAWLPD